MRPGPWTTKYKDRDRDELCVRDATGSIVADLRIHATVAEANLIAAAPTMLEALDWFLDAVRGHGWEDCDPMSPEYIAYDLARQAVFRARQATGEGA